MRRSHPSLLRAAAVVAAAAGLAACGSSGTPRATAGSLPPIPSFSAPTAVAPTASATPSPSATATGSASASATASATASASASATATRSATATPSAAATGAPTAAAATQAAATALQAGKTTGAAPCDANAVADASEHPSASDPAHTNVPGPAVAAGGATQSRRYVALGYTCTYPDSGDGGAHAGIALALVDASGATRLVAMNASEAKDGAESVLSVGFTSGGLVSADLLALGPDDPQCCPSQSLAVTLRTSGSSLVVVSKASPSPLPSS